jgi:hypothetical protein
MRDDKLRHDAGPSVDARLAAAGSEDYALSDSAMAWLP